MSITDLETRLHALAGTLEELSLGRYDRVITPGDDALGVVEGGVNDLVLDLQTLHLANQEKAAYLELQQRALGVKEDRLREQAAALAAQVETIAAQRALLDAREQDLATSVETIRSQSAAIKELNVPIIEVEDGIVALPVIGAIDAARALEIMDTLLTHVTAHRARHVILDMTGVGLLDTRTAEHLGKVIQAVRLLGARCVVSGLNPATATTLVDLGADLGGTRTFRTLKEGLRSALAGATLTRKGDGR